jgi:hypothetical protein
MKTDWASAAPAEPADPDKPAIGGRSRSGEWLVLASVAVVLIAVVGALFFS